MKELLVNIIIYTWAFLPFIILFMSYFIRNYKWYFKYPIILVSFHIFDFLCLFILSRIEGVNYIDYLSVWISLLLEFNLLIMLIIIIYLIIKNLLKKVSLKIEKVVDDKIKPK